MTAETVLGAPPGAARLVPADARLYLEIRDWNGLIGSPAGALLSDMLDALTAPGPGSRPASGPAGKPATGPAQRPAATQPAQDPRPTTRPTATQAAGTRPAASQVAAADASAAAGSRARWKDRLAAHIGLTQPGMLEQLSSGRLAIAADGWDTLGQAVLIAQPADPAAFEALLRTLPALPPLEKIRRYRLANRHELAFDGTCVVIGRRAEPSSLFVRTLALWTSRHGVALSDTADFRDRVRPLPAGSQMLIYLTGRSRSGQGAALPTILWPAAWNQFQSVAATLTVTPDGLVIETSTYPNRLTPARQDADRLLTQIPASTLLAWTQLIDYSGHYRRLSEVKEKGTFSFYRGVLENGMPPGSLDTGLLTHLVGETLFIANRVARPASTSPADGQPALWVPALTVAVETRAERESAATLQRALENLLMLLNMQPKPNGPLRIERVPIGPGGGTVHSIAIGRLLDAKPGSEILGQLQLSWTVTDGLVVVGTAREAVRELILARRGQAPLLAETLPARTAAPSHARTVLLAQPRLMSELLSSWADTFDAQPGLLVHPDWWAQLQSVRAVSLYQLGAIPGEVGAGSVEIAFIIPELPAADRLRAGDRVVAVEDQLLDPTDAIGSLEQLLARRPRAGAVQFRIIRDGCEEVVELPIAPPPPPPRQIAVVDFLKQASQVLQRFASARYSWICAEPETGTSRLELVFAPPR